MVGKFLQNSGVRDKIQLSSYVAIILMAISMLTMFSKATTWVGKTDQAIANNQEAIIMVSDRVQLNKEHIQALEVAHISIKNIGIETTTKLDGLISVMNEVKRELADIRKTIIELYKERHNDSYGRTD